MEQELANITCPVEAALQRIGGKYKMVILWSLREKIMRFNELQKEIPRATPKMLTQSLRELERDGLVVRKVYPVVPPKTEYSLSDYGKTVLPVVKSIAKWGVECSGCYMEH